jgi:RNA polymerase sigma-70 factor (ECF subfamily)
MNAVATWQGIDLGWAYGELLHGLARRTRCMHRAKDALHDAFLRYGVAPRAGVTDPQAYFRQVLRSVLVDHHRSAARLPLWADLRQSSASAGHQAPVRATSPAPDAHDESLDAILGTAPSAEVIAELRERLRLLQAVIDALPPRCREVFWLFRVEGCTQPEIAQRLGVSLNMVERHVMRALVDLRATRELLAP